MNHTRIRVLLIEDDPLDAETVERALRNVRTSIELHIESTLSSGVDRLATEPFDLVLSDLSLPDGHGRTIVSSLREQNPDIPVLVLTGKDDEQALEFLNAGVQDYLTRNQLTADLLQRSIRYAIQRHQNFCEIRQLLSDVQQAQELLERKNRSLAKLYNQAHEFVDNVSHEFRTPLTVIKEYVSLIREGLIEEPAEQKRLLHVVEDRADDLNIMVDDMLDVSKPEAGMLGAWRKNRTVESDFQNARASLERKVEVKRVELSWTNNVGDIELYCDSEKVGRVLTNLADEDLSLVSLVSVGIDEGIHENLAADVDSFLNCCLRRNDLLFRVDVRRWLIALPEPKTELEKYSAGIRTNLATVNRNRPFAAQPDISVSPEGSRRVSSHRDEILAGVSKQLNIEQPGSKQPGSKEVCNV